jgi:hypothetical protein
MDGTPNLDGDPCIRQSTNLDGTRQLRMLIWGEHRCSNLLIIRSTDALAKLPAQDPTRPHTHTHAHHQLLLNHIMSTDKITFLLNWYVSWHKTA